MAVGNATMGAGVVTTTGMLLCLMAVTPLVRAETLRGGPPVILLEGCGSAEDHTRKSASQTKRYTRSQVMKLIDDIAPRHRIDPDFIKAVAKTESNFDYRAVSPRGAMGVMQLIPETAQRFNVQEPFDPHQNIEGGIQFIKYLLKLFKSDYNLVLAAYHCGENRVLACRGIPNIASTRVYISRARDYYRQFSGKELAQTSIQMFKDKTGVPHLTNIHQ
ncbi:lytic transglycosylase domain-containing protein [bacterium]|nr:lytic transglycosylase domain-containing protein [candidate division CSSED10-310 bacterium]